MSFKTKYYATIMSRPENKLNVAEIRVLRWMNGHIRQDKIRNDNIRERERENGIASIVEKMVESRLKLFKMCGKFIQKLQLRE
jgi:hypothetical protein